MPLHFVPLAEQHLTAVRAFNQRMREGGAATDFLLPEDLSKNSSDAGAPIQQNQFIAVDEGQVRGGVIEMNQPGWLNGHSIRAHNHQSPLSEGLIDRRNAMVAWQMIRFLEERSDAAFGVGMGSVDHRWSQLLRKCEWSVRPVPFLFRVHRAGAFWRELPMLHSTGTRDLFARVAAVTGIGALALAIPQLRKTRMNGSIQQQDSWGDWADRIWERVRDQCSFAVQRNREVLDMLYPTDDPRLMILLIEKGGEPVGWAVCMEARLKNERFFGNLRVFAILDCVALPGSMAVTAALADRELALSGADLVFVNHSHAAWVRAFRAAGFLTARSNYMLAMSKTLTEAIHAQPGGDESIHITRGDGDGRCNLG
ncbi:MAG: hypothetical protein WB992_20600 [Bryobacteraceae bacterium]